MIADGAIARTSSRSRWTSFIKDHPRKATVHPRHFRLFLALRYSIHSARYPGCNYHSMLRKHVAPIPHPHCRMGRSRSELLQPRRWIPQGCRLWRGEPAELNEDKTDFAEAMWSLINICPRVPSSPKQATLTLQPYWEALLLPSGAA